MDFPTVAGSIKNINRDLRKCEMASPQKLGSALSLIACLSHYTTDEWQSFCGQAKLIPAGRNGTSQNLNR